MLTKDIRKTIDNARDVLVGKIPNPQSQIEQITIAMIYKFMDDMDIESVEFGGERQFFVEELSEYAWSKIMSQQLGNEARMNLYTEALDKLQLSSRIPKLFRDIFKGAYLPFRDGQTLTLFLKEINDLSYNNSENLGNGFEYLLSIMGSQGDAGQFRTPRHIIDFIVDIVKPTKADTILDPACGTAGFLISAYKFIQKTAEDLKQPLNPQERTALTENIQGYDISPDMVKLALVNMYLHKFKDPKIYEYDTLTQDTRWDNYFDCILANPPFMTPKGGIQPHNKFGVKANRSEVLFVDYIMEHLNSTGRAGVIVPEGIVFQSANAYKELRKKLVDENYLYAVVSLPSGIFQPYSGVKTSILFMDRQLAKKTGKVLFVEIQNDGFDLGAQRRPIDKNDLPKALTLINQWQNAINTRADFSSDSKMITIVEKLKLAENEEYNLTASRYKVTQDFSNCKWDTVRLEEVVDIYNGSTPLKTNDEYWNKDDIPWFTIEDIRKQGRIIFSTQKYITNKALKETSVKLLPKNTVLICCTASVGEHAITKIELTTNQQFNGLVIKEDCKDKLLPEYLFWITSTFKNELLRLSGKTSFEFVSVKTLKTIEIPLPPLEVQEEIVKELDGYQAVIDGAQKVVDNWKPTIPINPEWEKVKFEDLYLIPSKNGLTKPTAIRGNGYKMINMGELFKYNKIGNIPMSLVPLSENEKKTNDIQVGDLLFARQSLVVSGAGKCSIVIDVPEYTTFESHIIRVRLNKEIVNPMFYYYYLQSENSPVKTIINYQNQAGIKGSDLAKVPVIKPSLDAQNQIVAEIEKEENIVKECKKLIKLYQEKINTKIQSIWGDSIE